MKFIGESNEITDDSKDDLTHWPAAGREGGVLHRLGVTDLVEDWSD